MVLIKCAIWKGLDIPLYCYTNIYRYTDNIPILIIQTDRQHRAIDLAGFAASVLLPHGSSHVQEAANARKVLQTLRPCDPSHYPRKINKKNTFLLWKDCTLPVQVHSRCWGCGGDQVHRGERKYEAGLLFLPSAWPHTLSARWVSVTENRFTWKNPPYQWVFDCVTRYLHLEPCYPDISPPMAVSFPHGLYSPKPRYKLSPYDKDNGKNCEHFERYTNEENGDNG